ncbi:MAG: hypothetical protein ABJC09_01470 [Terriglobia bacterium]
MKNVTSAVLGLAFAGLSFAQAPAAAPAATHSKDAMSTTAPVAKKHVKKAHKHEVKAAPAASTTTAAPATK